ncbi:MAG: phosphopantetheine-binding protein [Syntrophales bacterium]|nr:phosphopantetheine-binding protein [Syntrophales bacterium]
MQTLEELIYELKTRIFERLNLEGVVPDSFDEDTPLFGDITGLDSIDALEIVVLLDKEYGIKITDSKEARKIFLSIRTIAEFVEQNRKR